MADLRPQRTDDPRSQSAPRTPGEERPTPEPDPVAANRDHPGQVAQRSTAPGGGIASAGGEARAEQRGFGDDLRPVSPGAQRPGSTDTGPFARPSPGRPDDRTASGIREFENPNRSGMAPLSVPDRDDRVAPAGSAGPAAAEVNDPNYSAANRAAEAEPDDPGYTRMDSGARGRTAVPARYNRHGGRVRDIMTADVNVATPQTELYYVARMMDERDVGAIPIVDSTDSMKLLGLVTDRDIVIRTIARRTDPNDLRAGDVMSAGVESVTPETSVEELVSRMERRQVRRMPVVENGRLVGIVAQADIARRGGDEDTGELVERISDPGR